METHATTQAVSVYDLDVLLKDKTKKVGVVDCPVRRSDVGAGWAAASRGSVAARTSVAVALGDVAFVDAVDNNLAALIESASQLETLEHCDVVVCVSAFGAEAICVTEKTRVAVQRAARVVQRSLSDPSTGAAPSAVHRLENAAPDDVPAAATRSSSEGGGGAAPPIESSIRL